MSIPIFLSYPRPFLSTQKIFIERLTSYLESQGFSPRTLGVTDYDVDAPLSAIRRLLLESNGLISIGFRKNYILTGTGKPNSDLNEKSYDISNQWLTTPWCHIESAMAFQIGLPILVFREEGVLEEGILDKGVLGIYMPTFDSTGNIDEYLKSFEFIQIIKKWEGYVRRVVETKGHPPQLY